MSCAGRLSAEAWASLRPLGCWPWVHPNVLLLPSELQQLTWYSWEGLGGSTRHPQHSSLHSGPWFGMQVHGRAWGLAPCSCAAAGAGSLAQCSGSPAGAQCMGRCGRRVPGGTSHISVCR